MRGQRSYEYHGQPFLNLGGFAYIVPEFRGGRGPSWVRYDLNVLLIPRTTMWHSMLKPLAAMPNYNA